MLLSTYNIYLMEIKCQIPNYKLSYYNVIKHPMDLSTIGAKLENGVYKNREGFLADFRLMIQNCKTYNHSESYAHGEAIALEAFFDKGDSSCPFSH